MWPYLEEYIARQRLAKIGFTEDFGNLDSEKAEIFLTISTEIDKLESEEIKRKKRVK